MNKKAKFLNLLIAIILIIPVLLFCGCGGDGGNGNSNPPTHDRTKWFTETELSAVGLSGLTAPVGLTGEISSSDSWFNDGYSFSQACAEPSILDQNAEIYLDYFKTNYNGYFGVAKTYASSSNAFWYKIEQKDNILDYFDDNPSRLYKIYYVTDTNTDDNGNFVKGSVYTFEIRYEYSTSANGYLFKLFVEKADVSHNSAYTYYFRMK